MKISGIDKDFEDIIYYLDSKGFKPFASCDGVEANHEEPNEVDNAYIAFLKSPRIINLMAEFFKDKENFEIILTSEDYFKPHKLYGNMISGTTYSVNFSNKNGEKTEYFKNIIKKLVEKEETILSKEQEKLDILEKVLEENSNSDLAFQVSINGNYEPRMEKDEKINKLTISTKSSEGKIEGNIKIQDERDMNVLASILSEKYNMNKMTDNAKEYPDTEFIMAECDKCSCSIYFTDEHFNQILEKIQYIRQIAHTLPTFESKEWIGSDEELFAEYYDEESDLDSELFEEDMANNFEKTDLMQREEKLVELEKEAQRLSKEEQEISNLNHIIESGR